MKTIYKKLLFLLLFLPFSVLAQSKISGTVTDQATGQPLPGVNVIVKGTTNGASTDFDGNFSLSNVNQGAVIEFTFLGYKSQNVSYTGQKNLNIGLSEDTDLLDEVVMIGYGTVKKKDATGSVAVVTAKDFNQGANVTADNLINGKIAGVSINAGGGRPGEVPTIRIRGGSSLLATNDPLVVVDGLPMNTSVLASINPNDIESYSVLKDASATAIYGSRASNGVILITTKRGAKSLQVDYNIQYGSGTQFNKVDVFSANDYRNYVNSVGTPEQIARLGNANTDWQDEIYRRTDFIDNNLTMRGNLFKTIPTRLTIGNTYQEGLRLTDFLNRNTVSLNMSPSFFNDHLKLRLAVNYTNNRRRNAPGVEGSAIRFDPTQPVYDATSPFEGFYEHRNGNTIADFAPIATLNPVATLLQTNNRSENFKTFGNFEVDYKFHFLPELRAVVNVGYDHDTGYSENFTSRFAASAPRRLTNGTLIPIGNSAYNEGTGTNQLLDAYFVYAKEREKVSYDFTAGYSYQKFETSGSFTRNRFDPDQDGLSFVGDPTVLIGFFGRSNITFNDKYLLTLSYRRDGTSRFGEENRWGNFPAAAFAWKLKDEFFSESSKVSDLKLRLGWGITGQQDIGVGTFFLSQFSVGDQFSQYQFGNDFIGVGIPSARNPFIRWEETYTYNAGIDFGFNDNRLNGSVDVFYKKSYDLFQTAPFADGSNFSNEGATNIGDMSVKGVEFSINYDVVRTDNVKWNVGFNATKFERRIDALALGNPIFFGDAGGGTGTTSLINQQGFTPGSFFVYKQLYNTDGSPIEGAFGDLNGDGIISADDRYIFNNNDPDFILGFSTSFNYKNFDFGFNLRANVGSRVLNTTRSTRSYSSLIQNGVMENISPFVNTTNFEFQNEQSILSDMFIEDASFLRMDFATMGYTFPRWLDGKASLRLFTGVQNPFIITKYSGLDPEIGNNGIDNTIYPRQRQFLFGANIKF